MSDKIARTILILYLTLKLFRFLLIALFIVGKIFFAATYSWWWLLLVYFVTDTGFTLKNSEGK